MTQAQLGELVDLSKRMISYYESNTLGPPVKILKKIADALNVTTSYLMHESPLKVTREDETSSSLRKHIEILKKLPMKEQRHIFYMIDLSARNAHIT